MKKSILFLFLMLTMPLFATKTAYVRVTIAGNTYPSVFHTMYIYEDDARTSGYDNGYDASLLKMFNNAYSVFIYGLIGSDEYETLATNNVIGQYLGFITNNYDTNYTLSFSNFSGHRMYLKDLLTGDTITISESTSPYAFSVASNLVGRKAINNRFVFVEKANACEPVFTNKMDSVLEGKTYLFGCQLLTEAGPYVDTLVNAAGCDSIVRLVLSTYSLPEPPASYRLCYTAGNFIIDNPDAAATAYILDSIGTELSSHTVRAAAQTTFTPAGLTTGNLYQVVGLHADTLFFRAR